MDLQRFAIGGRVMLSRRSSAAGGLARAYESPTRPRCLCMAGGVEMYVAFHRHFVIKRMPGTGDRHHAACPSFEPEAQRVGPRANWSGEAVIEAGSGRVELRVDFAWDARTAAGCYPASPTGPWEATHPSPTMSLRGLMHFLFERAGFNRWSPAMDGKRNQGVLHKYLTEAAEAVQVKGGPLVDRLYVPEPFIEPRRPSCRAATRPIVGAEPRDGHWPLAVVLGEFKGWDDTAPGQADMAPAHAGRALAGIERTWERTARAFAPFFEALDAESGVAVASWWRR